MPGSHSALSVRVRLCPASLPVVPEDASVALEVGSHKRSSEAGGVNHHQASDASGSVVGQVCATDDGPNDAAAALSPSSSPTSGSRTEPLRTPPEESTTISSSGVTMKRTRRRTMSLAAFKWPAHRLVPGKRTTNDQRGSSSPDFAVPPEGDESEHHQEVNAALDEGRTPGCTTLGLSSPG